MPATDSWFSPEGIEAVVLKLVNQLEPDEDIAAYLFLESPQHGRVVLGFESGVFAPPYDGRFLRQDLQALIKAQRAERVMLIVSAWGAGVAANNASELLAFKLHTANGGRVADWPGRVDVISVVVVERGCAPRTLAAVLRRYNDRSPSVESWSDSAHFAQPVISALQAGVAPKRTPPAVASIGDRR